MTTERRDSSWFFQVLPDAMKRVGGAEHEQLAWLMEFAQRPDLPGLKGNDLENVLADAAYFLVARGGGPVLILKPDVTAAKLTGMARTIRDALSRLVDGNDWILTHGRELTARQLRGRFNTSLKLTLPQWRYTGTFRGCFLAHAQDLVAARMEDIQRCKRQACLKLFVRADKRQRYCEENCSTLERQNKFRSKGESK